MYGLLVAILTRMLLYKIYRTYIHISETLSNIDRNFFNNQGKISQGTFCT